MPKQNMTAEQRRAATRLDEFVIKTVTFYRNSTTGAATVGADLPQDKRTDAILTEKGKCDAVVTITKRRIASRMSEKASSVADVFGDESE